MRSRGWRRPSAIVQADVGMKAVAAALAAVTRFLVAAERRGRVEPVERVGPDHARLHPADHRQDPAALLRPDAGRQAVRRVVGLLHGLLRRPEGEHGQDGTEDLLAGDPMALGDVREQGWPEEVAAEKANNTPYGLSAGVW